MGIHHPNSLLAPYGARGLKSQLGVRPDNQQRRAPYGARGLKSSHTPNFPRRLRSRPAWGAWIEMPSPGRSGRFPPCRAPYGARGLKFFRQEKNRYGLERLVVAAPVAVGANAEKMYVGVMLQRDPQTQRLYLHDAVAEKEPASQTGGHLSTTGPGGSESELYTANILRNALNVKKNNEGSSTRRTLHADVTQSTKSGESNAQPSTNSIRSGNEKNKSRLVWGAWIEIKFWRAERTLSRRRAPYGARGLKSLCDRCIPFPPYVAPRMGRVD